MNKHSNQKKRYGLFTAIAMIVGIVIGSGIFFKSDDVLRYTGGSVVKGVLVFTLAAVSIIFGSLSIAILAEKSKSPKGVIGYAEEFLGKRFTCVFGWFQTYLYFPALLSVVGWVFGVYACMLFGLPQTLEMQTLVAFCGVGLLFLVNTLAAKLGGGVQVTAMVMKLLPLLGIALMGLLFGRPEAGGGAAAVPAVGGLGWLAAIGPVAFSFDGWIISTSIAGEMEGRHLRLALILSPVFILLVYIAYFVGISRMIGPANIIGLGDQHLYVAAEALLGTAGAKVMLVFIVVSVMGTVNGVIIGMIRLPYLLAQEGMAPGSAWLSMLDSRTQTPIHSAFYGFCIAVLWLGIHYFSQRVDLLPGSDVSEIAIMTSYLLYIAFYVKVIQLGKGSVYNWVVSLLAILGSLIIFFSGMQDVRFWLYFLLCVLFMAGVYFGYGRQKKKASVQKD